MSFQRPTLASSDPKATARDGTMRDGYWVWVTRPEVYLDDDGEERHDLDPERGYRSGWWTCHPETKEGDLIVLYRTAPKSDIAYLIMARSDAYSLLDEPFAAENGWKYGCDHEFIEKFERPLSLAEMKADPKLDGWGALRAGGSGFLGSFYAVPADIWAHLLDRLSAGDRPRVEERMKDAAAGWGTEKWIENQIAANPALFEPHGLELDLCSQQHWCRHGGRADLIYVDRKTKGYVVVEVKRDRDLVKRDAVAQLLSYRASVDQELPARQKPIGVLVGRALNNEALGMIEDDERLRFIALSEIELDLDP